MLSEEKKAAVLNVVATVLPLAVGCRAKDAESLAKARKTLISVAEASDEVVTSFMSFLATGVTVSARVLSEAEEAAE